jgi:hypothetical protein
MICHFLSFISTLQTRLDGNRYQLGQRWKMDSQIGLRSTSNENIVISEITEFLLSSHTLDSLRRSGYVKLPVQLLSSTSLDVQEHAATALARLLLGSSSFTDIVVKAAGGMQPLVQLSSSPGITRHSSACLSQLLSPVNSCGDAIVEAQGISPLVVLLSLPYPDIQARSF